MNDRLRKSLMDLTPAQMRERAIDYELMAGVANTADAKARFLLVAAQLRELARQAKSDALVQRRPSATWDRQPPS
jgi:hypothetical protein